jgi:hypothetical protein
MGHVIRLRISLTDRAGALAQAANVIGLHGGNIMSIDVHHIDGQSAVDDVVVDFSSEPDTEDIRDDLAMNAATTLISHQASSAADPVVASMDRVVKLLEAGFEDSAGLADAVADLCAAPLAWVSTAEEARRYDAGRLALETNRPAALATTDLPEHLSTRPSEEMHLLAIPDLDHAGGSRVVFVAQPVPGDFTATEIGRIETLTALYNRLAHLVEGPPPTS